MDYERLEFLGDRVVNLVVADLLFNQFKDEREGALAKRHTALVQNGTLADIASELSLGDFVILSDAERRAGGAEQQKYLGRFDRGIDRRDLFGWWIFEGTRFCQPRIG